MKALYLAPALLLLIASCNTGTGEKAPQEKTRTSEHLFTPVEGKVRLMNLAPGHFHASLVQKIMYGQVDPVVHVYAPKGPEVEDYLKRIGDYNAREENPTAWEEVVYTGDDYLEKMLEEKPGNVMVVSGNNARKTEYILEAARAGIHVLADKPMVISPEAFPMLEEAFRIADEKGVLIYDIMTERYEITTTLQKAVSRIPEIFGELEKGSPEDPAITKESVHHFAKIVSGKPLVRPPWFFDVRQQGEGLVDVGTHLVDLVQWEAFPEVVLSKEDVEILSARRWSTDLDPGMFQKVTELDAYPGYLAPDLEGDVLKVYCNNEVTYRLKGIHVKVSAAWNFEAPEGTGDTHYSIMRGSRCNLVIRQGEEEGYTPTLYIEAASEKQDFPSENGLNTAFYENLAPRFPGVFLRELEPGRWVVGIPDKYRVGHEAHFGQVTEKYLGFLEKGALPAWEIPNMIVKYYTTTEGLKKAMER
jgi:predicted dehydrogenase